MYRSSSLDPDGSTDVDDGQPVPGDLPLDAAVGAAQLAGDLVQGEQQGVRDGRGGDAGVCCGLHVAPK